MHWYATREAVKLATVVADTFKDRDSVFDEFIKSATADIDALMSRRFIPYLATRYYSFPMRDMPDPYSLPLDEDLISLVSFKADNGTRAIDVAKLFLEPTAYGPPYDTIDIDRSTTEYFSWSTTPQRALHVEGLWGYSQNLETGSTLAVALTDTVGTTIDVTSGANFGVGDSIKMEDERMFIEGRDPNDTTLFTVRRGEHGSAAATHAQGVTVSKIVPPRDITNLCKALAINYYHMAQGGWTGQAGGSEATIEIRGKRLQDLQDRIVKTYRRTAQGRA